MRIGSDARWDVASVLPRRELTMLPPDRTAAYYTCDNPSAAVTNLHTLPPGRTGRIRLRERLQSAKRGVELLDGKLRVLRGEQRR